VDKRGAVWVRSEQGIGVLKTKKLDEDDDDISDESAHDKITLTSHSAS